MNFTRYLQENLLVLLVFEKDLSKIVRSTVEPQLFGGVYKEIVARIYDYIDKHKASPNEHIADLLEDKLESSNKREAKQYRDIVQSIHDAKGTVNTEYVMSQLENFVKRQSLRSVAVDLAKALQKDTEESLEVAEGLIASARSTGLKLFDPGLRLSDTNRALRFLDMQSDAFRTGIPEFDVRGFGPTRKEMYLYIADTKTGKTWSMIHLAKIALMNSIKVLHVTLEMSEDKVAQRYMQAFFAISKRMGEFETQRFKKDEDGQFEDFKTKTVKPTLAFDDPEIHKKLRAKHKRWAKRAFDNIIIKQFPTGKLSLSQLEAYMDNLEATEGFAPDLLIVDYPDLMELPNSAGGQYRHGLAAVYKGLRGTVVARNCALAVPTQANRAAAGAKQVGRANVSEAYSKIADADVVVTYSQTSLEKELGLARLSVVAGRNDEDNITVVLSQNYGMGQYVVDSVLVNKKYNSKLDQQDGDDDSGDPDYEDDDDE